MILIHNANQVVTVASFGDKVKRGRRQGEIFVIEKGSVLIKDEKIEWVGRAIDFNFGLYGDEVEIVDATGKVVLPGFVDSHTHLVFAGTRESEFDLRIKGFAKSYDPRIKVESTGFGNVIQRRTLASSNGFIGEYEGTIFEIYCSTIASEDGESQTGFYSSVSRFFDKLQTPEFVAKNASIRALQLLHPQKIKTGRYPVIFDPITSATLVSYISSAVNGKNTYRKMSFLFDKIGEKIANESLTVIDNGRFEDGIASKPFDDEGIETRENLIIENGVLKMFLLDSITAKKFALPPTGNAHRKYNTIPAPAPTNFYIKPGNKSPEEIINEINEGLLITKLIGFGVDIVSGNFSKGASGLWIKNGEIAFAVDKITIADNLSDILRNITLVGNDIIFFSNIASPTILVSEMTVTCD